MAIADSLFTTATDDTEAKYTPPTFKITSGMQTEDGLPKQLGTWRFESEDREVLERLAEIHGGTVEEFHTPGRSGMHVISTTREIDVIFANEDSVDTSLIQWVDKKPAHHCNGQVFLSPKEEQGDPCGCPPTLKAIKARAKSGRGPKPYTKMEVTLPEDQDLGPAVMTSSAWGMAKAAGPLRRQLGEIGGEVLVTLAKEFKSFISEDDELIEYWQITPKVRGSFNAAVAEDA